MTVTTGLFKSGKTSTGRFSACHVPKNNKRMLAPNTAKRWRKANRIIEFNMSDPMNLKLNYNEKIFRLLEGGRVNLQNLVTIVYEG
jgi:hypothetical protein